MNFQAELDKLEDRILRKVVKLVRNIPKLKKEHPGIISRTQLLRLIESEFCISYRTCIFCKVELHKNFFKGTNKKCNGCYKIHRGEWAERNREKIKTYNKEYRRRKNGL